MSEHNGNGKHNGEPHPEYKAPLIKTRTDLGTVDRALRHGWQLPEGVRAKLPAALNRMAMTHKSSRVRMMAAKLILQMNQQNIDLETPKAGVNVTVGQTVDVHVAAAEIRREVLSDPAYLDYCRSVASDGDPGVVRQDDKPGPLADGKAFDDPGPGTNGHSHG